MKKIYIFLTLVLSVVVFAVILNTVNGSEDEYTNIVNQGDIPVLDSYHVVNSSYQPYPSSYGIKFKKVDNIYRLVDNNGDARVATNCFVASKMPLNQDVNSDINDYYLETKLTGIESQGAISGYGMLIGWYNNYPVSITLNESNINVAYDLVRNQITFDYPSGLTYGVTQTYVIKVVVKNSLGTLFVNNVEVGNIDYSSLNGFVPAIGPTLQRCKADYEYFNFYINNIFLPKEPDYNIVDCDKNDLIDSYAVVNETFQPYPDSYGIKMKQVDEKYELVNANGEVRGPISAFVSFKLPLLFSATSGIETYTVSCKITGKEKANWGGYGVLFGYINGYSVAFVITESYFQVAFDKNSFAKTYSFADTEFEFNQTGTYDVKVVVKNRIATFLVDDIEIGTYDFSKYNLIPACGAVLENYTASFSDFELNVFEEDTLKNKISFFDGENELKQLEGAYKNGVGLAELPLGPEKSGYEFVAWYDNSSLSGNPITKILSSSTGDISLYAKYEQTAPSVSNIAYYDGDTRLTALDDTYNFGEIKLLAAGPSKNELVFYGWYDNSSLSGNPIDKLLATDFGDKVFYAKYIEAEKMEEVDYSKYTNIFDITDDSLLDCYAVLTEENRPYPNNWGLKIMKIDDAYCFVDNQKQPRTKTTAYFTSKFALTQVVNNSMNNYVVSGSVTYDDHDNYCGIGLLFGFNNSDPLTFVLGQNNMFISASKKEVIKAFSYEEAGLAFSFTSKYDITIIVQNNEAIFGVNGVLVGSLDLSEYEDLTPSVGFVLKNATGKLKNPSLYLDNKDVIVENFVNVVDDSYSEMINAYGVTNEEYQPFPFNFGLRLMLIDGKYEFVNNNGTIRDSITAFMSFELPLVVPVSSEIKNYFVECTVTGKEKSSWGGYGIMFGSINGYAAAFIITENYFQIALNKTGFVKTFPYEGTGIEFSQTGTYRIKVVVKNNTASFIVNDVKVGSLDVTQYSLIPACGAILENYSATFTDFSLNILEEDTTFNKVTYYNGNTLIKGLTGAYKSGIGLILENGPDMNGFKFAGWYLNSDLTGDIVTSIPTSSTGDVTLYGKYVLDTDSYKDIAKDYSNALVPTSEVATNLITQYLDYLKFKEIEGEYIITDNQGNPRDGSGMYIGAMVGSDYNLSGITSWISSVDVTGVQQYEYGGYGIVFGWWNNKPATFILTGNNFAWAFGNNEWSAVVAYKSTGITFSNKGSYHIDVVVEDLVATFYVNGKFINRIDLSKYEGLQPCVGYAIKNYAAKFKNVHLLVDKELELVKGEPIDYGMPDPEVLHDYDNYENLVIDTYGLLDTYGGVEEFRNEQPFDNENSMKVTLNDGVYRRVNNLMIPSINSAFTVTYLPTIKDVSKAFKYTVQAHFKLTNRDNWGGVGLVIGKNIYEDTNSYMAPVCVWVSEPTEDGNCVVTISYDFIEWTGDSKVIEGDFCFEVGSEFDLKVFVEGYKIHIYLDDKFLTTLTLSKCNDFVPTLGLVYKNWNADVSNIVFKSTSSKLKDSTFVINKYSGGVSIGKQEYQYSNEKVLLTAIEREGYEFMGWHLLPDLSDKVITEIPEHVGGDVNLYCEYRKQTYTITYYDGNNVIENDDLITSFKYRNYVELVDGPSKKKYKFDGWYLSPDFSGDKVTEILPGVIGNQVLYAKYVKAKGCKSEVTSSILLPILLGSICIFKKKKEY